MRFFPPVLAGTVVGTVVSVVASQATVPLYLVAAMFTAIATSTILWARTPWPGNDLERTRRYREGR